MYLSQNFCSFHTQGEELPLSIVCCASRCLLVVGWALAKRSVGPYLVPHVLPQVRAMDWRDRCSKALDGDGCCRQCR
jgi:hypothetical protein